MLFNCFPVMLFIFPSRYLCAIGLPLVFSFGWRLPPALSCTPKQLDSLFSFCGMLRAPSLLALTVTTTKQRNAPIQLSGLWVLRGSHPLWHAFPLHFGRFHSTGPGDLTLSGEKPHLAPQRPYLCLLDCSHTTLTTPRRNYTF